jgi:hypothetical protein
MARARVRVRGAREPAVRDLVGEGAQEVDVGLLRVARGLGRDERLRRRVVRAQGGEPVCGPAEPRTVRRTPCHPRPDALLGGFAPDVELAALAAPQHRGVEEAYRRAHLIAGADEPRRRRVGVAVGTVIAHGPDAEALGEQLEDPSVVAAQLDDRTGPQPAQPEAAFAREEAAEVGQQG